MAAPFQQQSLLRWSGMLLMSALYALGADPKAESQAFMAVNGETVEPAEVRWFLDQKRKGLTRTTTVSNRTDVLSSTITRTIREKVEQLLWKDLGLITNISYSSYLAEWRQMNLHREHGKARGEIIYGPVQLTELQYYLQRRSRLRTAAIEKLADTQLSFSRTELVAFCRTRGISAGSGDDLHKHREALLSRKYDELLDTLVSRAKTEVDPKQLEALSNEP